MRSLTWRGIPRWRSDDEDAALDGVPTGPVDPAVDELLAALAAEPRPYEVEGVAEPLTAYRAAFAGRQLVPTAARRGLVLTGLLGAKAAAAAGGVALGLAATAMAVAVNLPDTGADRTPVSPAASTSTAKPTAKSNGVGPDATGPAAHGLCTAWSNHQRTGNTAPMDSPPMRNLAEAAGGEGKIAAYCATVPHPGNGPKGPKPGKDKDKDKAGQSPSDKGPDTDEDDGPTPTPKPTAKPTTTTTATATATPTPSPSTSSSTAPAPSDGGRSATPRSKGS